MDEDVHDDQL